MKKFVHVSLITLTMTVSSAASAATPRGVDRANLDESIAPQEDFYQYACGGWMKNNPLKPEYSRFGIFDQLAELNREQIKELINGLSASNPAKGTNAQKIADMFALGMDSVRLNDMGASPILADLATINASSSENIPALLATMPGVDAFFGSGVEADMLNSSVNAMYVMQGGLGLGDRDYYIEDSENVEAVREAYKKYLHTVAKLCGYSDKDADRFVKNVMEVETELAKAMMSREELRDPAASYNPMSLDVMQKRYPAINFKEYFAWKGLDNVPNVVVGQPKYLDTVNKLISRKSTQALRDYIAAGYISSATPFLSDDFINAAFELSKVKTGVQQMQPRWKRAVSVPNGILGEALGQLYVEKYFPQSSKDKMTTLVSNLQEALGQHIDNLTWMSDETKAKAQEKLASFVVKIGFPDKWRDYSSLEIDPEKSYWANIQEAIIFNENYNINDYGKPVDKSRWYMTPQTVNAYYNPTSNEICFPAGILQAPYFNPDADDAENYGAIGVVIGHEMTHGFDDQGRQFDKDGNLANWWTDEDAEAFNKLADKLVEQFNEIIVAGDTHANGRFTLGENIADQGGLRVAHTAYLNSQKGKEPQLIDGFTPDQRFYLAYANVWANNIREAEILSRTKSDPHSLGRWRVNASLRNIEPFFNAFNIKEGDKMFRPVEERVIIW